MVRNCEEKKAISSEAIKAEKEPIEALLSLEEEVFLSKLTMSPYLFEFKKVEKRLEKISKAWKKRIELKKSRKSSWENILYLVHLFPRSLDLPQFTWLKEKYLNILMRRQWSSELDKSYWEVLDRVRKDFTPTKPKTPEKKQLVARKFEYYQNLWARAEILKRCRELLEIYNSAGMEEEILKTQFLRRVKISRDITERELERLDRICKEEVKDERDYLFLPFIIEDELNLIKDKGKKEEGKRFWLKIWKPISKEAAKLKQTFMMEVVKETGLSQETVRKLLRKAKKESGD